MWVLDTSVAVKWFFKGETYQEQAHHVLQTLIERPKSFVVPALFFYEIAAVLIKKSEFKESFVQEELQRLYQLGIPTFEIGAELQQKATWLACRQRISYYDALFVALASLLKRKWLTADQEALKRLPSSLGQSLEKFSA